MENITLNTPSDFPDESRFTLAEEVTSDKSTDMLPPESAYILLVQHSMQKSQQIVPRLGFALNVISTKTSSDSLRMRGESSGKVVADQKTPASSPQTVTKQSLGQKSEPRMAVISKTEQTSMSPTNMTPSGPVHSDIEQPDVLTLEKRPGSLITTVVSHVQEPGDKSMLRATIMKEKSVPDSNAHLLAERQPLHQQGATLSQVDPARSARRHLPEPQHTVAASDMQETRDTTRITYTFRSVAGGVHAVDIRQTTDNVLPALTPSSGMLHGKLDEVRQSPDAPAFTLNPESGNDHGKQGRDQAHEQDEEEA